VLSIEEGNQANPNPSGSSRTVRLENITPSQLRLIEQIESDINRQNEEAIRVYVTNLKASQPSSYSYRQSLDALELELKNNITNTVRMFCEPGLSQYSDPIARNFDRSKINDLEKYLEIKLANHLREYIYYAKSESSTYHSTSLLQGSSSQSNNPYGHIQNENPERVQQTPLEQGYVKGGKASLDTTRARAPYGAANINPDVEYVSTEFTSELQSTEPTTPAESWWARFGNKVKQGASNLKQKIVGNS